MTKAMRAAPISKNCAARAYFVEKRPLTDYDDLHKRLQSGDIDAAVEIPPGFGRDIERGRPAWVGAWVDGAMPFRAETIRGYLQAMHQLYLTDPAVTTTIIRRRSRPPESRSGTTTTRISTASTPWCRRPCPCCSRCFPAILMALAIVREKELGSITNLYVTPVTRLEFLIGKQIPYVGVADDEFPGDVPDGAVCFSGAAERQLHRSAAWCRDLRHHDDGLRHADFVVCQHADRSAVRHRHYDRFCRRRSFPACRCQSPRSRPAGADHGAGVSDDLFPARSPSALSPRDWASAILPSIWRSSPSSSPRCC